MKAFAKQPESDTIAAMMGDPKFRGLAAARDPDVYAPPSKPPLIRPPSRRYLAPVRGASQAGLRVRLDENGQIRLSSGLYRLLAGHVPGTPIPELYVRVALVDGGELVIERCAARDQWAGKVSSTTNQLTGAYDWGELRRAGYRAGWFFAESNEAGTEATIRPDGYLGEFMPGRRKRGQK